MFLAHFKVRKYFFIKNRKFFTEDVYLLLVKSSKLLLLERKNTGYFDGYYHPSAGHKEQSESFIQALIRETKEEIGIKLLPNAINFVHVMYNYSSKNNERVGIFFEAKVKQKLKNMEPSKCNEIRWVDLYKLPDKIVPYALQTINCYKKKIFYSEYNY